MNGVKVIHSGMNEVLKVQIKITDYPLPLKVYVVEGSVKTLENDMRIVLGVQEINKKVKVGRVLEN